MSFIGEERLPELLELLSDYFATPAVCASIIESKLSTLSVFSIQVVDELPSAGSSGVMYLVPMSSTASSDSYAEYLWVNNVWEKVGSTTVAVSAATSSSAGIVKPDNVTISVSADGTITAIHTPEDISEETFNALTRLSDGLYVKQLKGDGESIIEYDDGTLSVNSAGVPTSSDIALINESLDNMQSSTPVFVAYEDDELYDMVWNKLTMTPREDYTQDELDAMLDQVDLNNLGKWANSSATEITKARFDELWASVFGGSN